MSAEIAAGLRRVLGDPVLFSRVLFPGRVLRHYQRVPARAVGAAIVARHGGATTSPGAFVCAFARQSGKDEVLAQLLAWLLVRYQHVGGTAVVAAPTLNPQAALTRDRLVERMMAPRVRALGLVARVRDGTVVELGRASVHFVSAGSVHARGQTASLLLVGNEAQDLSPDRWDSVFAPMASATDAVTLWLGTPWTADTLLARQTRYLRDLEAADGRRRAFLVPWGAVAEELPNYGRYVRRQVAQLGADHPFIRTEYELEELDGQGGLFPASRRGQMRGEHAVLARGLPGETYCLLVDVAGEEEEAVGTPGSSWDPGARRDATAATVVRVIPSTAPLRDRPRYEVVRRYAWTGVKHTALHAQLVDLARDVWHCRYVVVDATGVGAGLTSFLRASLGERVVIPFVFGFTSKSQLGWAFLGAIDAGRFKDHAPVRREDGDPESAALDRVFWTQVRRCRYEVRRGPGRLMSWSVPDPAVHDDLLLSAALVAVLDRQDWRPREAVGSLRRTEDPR
ncbi:MAG TPA: hypothetical protein VFN57_07905 [Thermomicrobiaceae bacterium]|nr:hypothetical protein [Thermomicrobiaceae bacterium]